MYFPRDLYLPYWPAESIKKISDRFLQMNSAVYGFNPRTDDNGIAVNPGKYVVDVASTRKMDARQVRAWQLFFPRRDGVSDLSNVNATRSEQHFQHLSLVGNRYL